MKASITHVAIYTMNLEQMKTFYETYFDAKSNEKYENASGFSSYFLMFDSGARLELMSHIELKYREVVDRMTGLSHIAFSVGSKEVVITLTNRLHQDGYQVVSGPRHTGDGYFESAVLDPDGNCVEITE